jgi:signal transduction histidine kinase
LRDGIDDATGHPANHTPGTRGWFCTGHNPARTAGFVGIRNLWSIQANAASLVEEQSLTTRLIDEVQREQGTLSAIFYHLERDPSVDRFEILRQLDEADRHIEQILSSLPGAREALWEEFRSASAAFSSEARRLLTSRKDQIPASRELLHRHQQVMAIVARLIAASHEKANAAESQIHRRSEELVRQSLLLLGTSLALGLLCSFLTARITTDLFRRMERQAGELSRVSWHMLENQESAARRFSHELHDELGQSLTAIKANLVAIQSQASLARVQDCVGLVDEAVRNVRQLSQLLHPTILDDFGLAEGFRWLAEGFTQRTGISVECRPSFNDRLPEEAEIHLFRICQEALTNIARHSRATRVAIDLSREGDSVRLLIADNGCGIKIGSGKEGLGMIGMRARARSIGGELEVRSGGKRGFVIEAKVPIQGPSHAQEDQNRAG